MNEQVFSFHSTQLALEGKTPSKSPYATDKETAQRRGVT